MAICEGRPKLKESFVNFCENIKPFNNIIDINTIDNIYITDNIVINKIYVEHCKNSLGYNINLENNNILIIVTKHRMWNEPSRQKRI